MHSFDIIPIIAIILLFVLISMIILLLIDISLEIHKRCISFYNGTGMVNGVNKC